MNKKDDRDRQYTQEDIDLMLQNAENILKDTENMIARQKARLTVNRKKKYMFMISYEMMIFLTVIGGFVLIAAVVYASDCISVRHNSKAAFKAVGFAVAVLGLIVFWILKSLKLKKEFDSDVEKTMISGEYDNSLFSHAQKKAKDVEIKYRIERLERLSKNELLEATKEWQSINDIITDSFYRFFPDYYACIKNNKLYRLFIEIRYEGGYPDSERIKNLEERISEEISFIEDFDLSKQMFRFKERIKEIVSKNFPMYISNLKLKEVCVAVVLEEQCNERPIF